MTYNYKFRMVVPVSDREYWEDVIGECPTRQEYLDAILIQGAQFALSTPCWMR